MSTIPAPKKCMSEDDCSALECCHKEHEALIVSKRDSVEDLANKEGIIFCESN